MCYAVVLMRVSCTWRNEQKARRCWQRKKETEKQKQMARKTIAKSVFLFSKQMKEWKATNSGHHHHHRYQNDMETRYLHGSDALF